MVPPINQQYYDYTQVHELIGDRKKAFCKQYRRGICRSAFGRHSLINKLKTDNEVDKLGAEAATASKSLPSDSSLLSPRSSTTRTRSSTGNTKQFEQICSVCNEICPCDSNAYNESGWGVSEFKSAGDRLMDAANAIDETNDLYVAKQRLIIHISCVGHIQRAYLVEIRYHRSCYSQFTYRKSEDKDVIKQKSYEEVFNNFMKKN